MKKNKTALFLILLVFCIAALTGCWSQRELKALTIVMGMGLDKDESNPQNIKLTAQIVLPERIKGASITSNAAGEPIKPWWNIESTGKTTFEAIRQYSQKLSNRLYIAHTQIFIIGKKLAEEGIEKPLDFFIRAKETRPSTKLLVSRTTASEILNTDTKLNLMPAINISSLIDAYEFSSNFKDITVNDYINGMLSKTTDFVALMVDVVEEGGIKIPNITGLAIFKGDRMVGEFDRYESRGLLWIRGWVKSGVINVQLPDGMVALEIINAKGDIVSELDGKKVKMKIKVQMNSVMGEQTSIKNYATVEGMNSIGKLAEKEIIREMTLCWEKARSLNVDVFGFGEAVHISNPSAWKSMEEQWDKIFPAIDLELEVKVNVTGAGVIIKPIVPATGEKGK